MLNFAVGLSLITYWVSFYFPLPDIGLSTYGVALAPLAVLVGSLVIWVVFLRIRSVEKSRSRKIPSAILIVGNVLAMSTIVVHAYSALSPPAASSVEEIMSQSAPQIVEQFLSVVYPFAKMLVLFGVALNGYYAYKALDVFKRGAAIQTDQ